jgi:SagB-type dehydrogenase family enzyme
MNDFSSSIAYHYHQRTKYDPQTIQSKGRQIDWSQQPVPFKEYKIGTIFDLKPYIGDEIQSEIQSKDDPTTIEWRRLSKLLLCSYGLTAKLPTMFGSFIYLRSAPSAGGLYPAEVYLISRGTALLPAGIYSYQAQTHSLILFWQHEVWTTLQMACFRNPVLEKNELALVTTAIFERSAWRYEDRAYRRICLDTGHLLGNIELATSINNYRAYFIGGFQDKVLNDLLYLDETLEGAITVICLEDKLKNPSKINNHITAFPSNINTNFPRLKDGELLAYLHQSSSISGTKIQSQATGEQSYLEDKYNFPFCLKVSTKSNPVDWKENLSGLENTILSRRSTRSYTGANLNKNELNALLDFTYHPENYANQNIETSPDYFTFNLIETFIAVSGVDGLDEGCYYYAPKEQELRQIRFKNFRRELHYLCLGQDLGRDAGAVIFHTADLNKAIEKYGDRSYRYLHLDAGNLGQRLNLAAIHLGLGVSGIGGFFDDQVNEVLGIPVDEAVLYITTLGRPRRNN